MLEINIIVSRLEIIISGCLMSFPPFQDKKPMVVPDIDNPNYTTRPISYDMVSRLSDNSGIERLIQDSQNPTAWERLQWLLSAFRANGQRCDMKTIIESTFRGEDLYYINNETQSKINTRPSSTCTTLFDS
ncbi:hypothetical protein M0802_009855 [Mischocyttarus mexicanus]|nr:hypothetical protein M0802_009855 [Mischocyttarus mexicanus]